jgi:hypothetical protein
MSDYKPTELDIFKAEYYAEKLKRPDPWRDVEYRHADYRKNTWCQISGDPMFSSGCTYRWKMPTIKVNGANVPAPVIEKRNNESRWRLCLEDVSRNKSYCHRENEPLFTKFDDAKEYLKEAIKPAIDYINKNKY